MLRNGKPCMALCTPGGDVQQQTNLQVFLNVTVFGMNAQQATEAARFATFSFPDSFYPHLIRPGEIAVEERIGDAVIDDLVSRGHRGQALARMERQCGRSLCHHSRPGRQVLHAGADPRRDAYAVAS